MCKKTAHPRDCLYRENGLAWMNHGEGGSNNSSSWNCQNLTAEQPLPGGTICQGRQYVPSITVQITPAGPQSWSSAGQDALLDQFSTAFSLCGILYDGLVSADRARIYKQLRSPGIDYKESIPPTHIAWRAGTSNRFVVPARQAGNWFLASLKSLQILDQRTCVFGNRLSTGRGGGGYM